MKAGNPNEYVFFSTTNKKDIELNAKFGEVYDKYVAEDGWLYLLCFGTLIITD